MRNDSPIWHLYFEPLEVPNLERALSPNFFIISSWITIKFNQIHYSLLRTYLASNIPISHVMAETAHPNHDPHYLSSFSPTQIKCLKEEKGKDWDYICLYNLLKCGSCCCICGCSHLTALHHLCEVTICNRTYNYKGQKHGLPSLPQPHILWLLVQPA